MLLGRAFEVNIVGAAQKPSGNIMSTQMRDNISSRACIGPVVSAVSKMILDSQHGTRFPDGAPPGRGWWRNVEEEYTMFQGMWLPDWTVPFPSIAEADPAERMPGAIPLLRQRMQELGYVQVQVQNTSGGTDPRWVRADQVEQ